MGQNTTIEWCDHTFNPWRGCAHRVLPNGTEHPGCAHCYAEAMSKRNPTLLGEWGEHGIRVCAAPEYWRQPEKWNRQAELDGCRRLVFCASMADVFEDWDGLIFDHANGALFKCRCGWQGTAAPHKDHPTEWRHCPQRGSTRAMTMDDMRSDLFDLIYTTPNLDWLLLTKRPELAAAWLREERANIEYDDHTDPFANVWLGTSISSQATADALVPELFKCRDLVPVLFLSIEPLLGPVDLRSIADDGHNAVNCLTGNALKNDDLISVPTVDWVIVGGESGHHARPMHPDWVRSLRDQCAAFDVPFFLKQWGEWAPSDSVPNEPQEVPTTILKGTTAECVVMRRPSQSICWVDTDGPVNIIGEDGKFTGDAPRGVCMTRAGKHAAGRLLDGRAHSEFPAPSFTPNLSPAEPAQ